MDSMPSELDDIRRKILQLEIEEVSLKNETDKLSGEHLKEVRQELSQQRGDRKDQFSD